jgi:hypothetical protein
MAKTLKTRPGILVTAVEEVPRISDAEREALRESLERGRIEIAAGNYDLVTPATLRREFEDIFRGSSNAKAKLGTALSPRTTSKRKRR